MVESLVKISDIQTHYNVAGTRVLKYSIEIYHNGLKEHKVITAPEIHILKNKEKLQIEKWNKKFGAVLEKQNDDKFKKLTHDNAMRDASKLENELSELDELLSIVLNKQNFFQWDTLKKYESFSKEKPKKPNSKYVIPYPALPEKASPDFTPTYTLIEKIFKSKKASKDKIFEEKYNNAMLEWEKKVLNVDKSNEKNIKNYHEDLKRWEEKLVELKKQNEKFIFDQEQFNATIDNLKIKYNSHDEEYVVQYLDFVLSSSKYPDNFPRQYDIEYNKKTKLLTLDYELPSIDCINKIKEIRYNSQANKTKEILLSESDIGKRYDDTLYKICLRTIYELFYSDSINAISSIAFNGFVSFKSKSDGIKKSACVMTVYVSKDIFIKINFIDIDPKQCFKGLKGISASTLINTTPVQPLIQINRRDKRFVDSYNVTDTLDNSTNLAALDWEDFEHLVREIFEKEFLSSGGEVKVTQSSRDGGVDAVAFDPDPIRGGKIIIQAKRYTNTVGVSAVRDLFGTLQHEGANKGILVTTSDYGPDAYAFAQGKPLTLINGSNLLYMLQKHGHNAKIDISEAKMINDSRR